MLGFRVWDNIDKKFINTDSFVMSDTGCLAKLHGGGGVYCDADRYIPMQSTGVTDSSKKDIFEGDVLKIFDKPGHPIYYLYHIDSASEFLMYYGSIYSHTQELKITGNVYESPELLEQLK